MPKFGILDSNEMPLCFIFIRLPVMGRFRSCSDTKAPFAYRF